MHGRILGAAIALLALPATAQAGVVTSTGNDGDGSLRAVVEAASGPETIEFQAGLGTITLTDPLTIGVALSLAGPATIAMDGDAALLVTSAAQSKLDRITITGAEPSVRVKRGADLLVQRSSLAGIVFDDGSAGALGGLQDFGNTVLATGDAVLLGEDADVNVSHNTIVSERATPSACARIRPRCSSTRSWGGTGGAGLELVACDDAQVITQNTIGGRATASTSRRPAARSAEPARTTATRSRAPRAPASSSGPRDRRARSSATRSPTTAAPASRIEPGATARLVQNTIADNGGLGIDVAPAGPSGNRPTLTAATREEGQPARPRHRPAPGGFTLRSSPSAACDPSGSGEGAAQPRLGRASPCARPAARSTCSCRADTAAGTSPPRRLTGADQVTTEFSGCATIARRPGTRPGPAPAGPGPGTDLRRPAVRRSARRPAPAGRGA